MSVAVDPKEDLRLRMADLEKKLSESEEERCKLEKTCNVLMRAFKEEEKMRYKALNKKYEKFLEDCTVRKRRNDIILRSLCRIEDRSKVLFAKTERLKLLKDRYMSYMRVNDVKKDEFQSWKTFPLGTQKTSDVTSKLIQWKTPPASYNKREDGDVRGSLFSSSGGFHATFGEARPGHVWRDKPEEVQRYESRINEKNGFSYLSHNEEPRVNARDELNFRESNLGLQDRRAESGSHQTKVENWDIENKCQNPSEAASLKERGVISHQESIEKLKKTLMPEEECLDNERHDPYVIIEKDNTEQSEKNPAPKQNNSHDELIPIINHNLVISSPITGVYKEQKHEAKSKEMKAESPDLEEENVPRSDLPMGLDGVDYENETYPESYYEQPPQHSHVSIASDVILEEDETEQEEADKDDHLAARSYDFGSSSWVRSPERGIFNEPERKASEKPKGTDDATAGRVNDEVKGRESESEKSAELKRSSLGDDEAKTDRSENVAPAKANKSNLIHLLESDSESFQIEHGDAVSGNEDSEFDFSFGQN